MRISRLHLVAGVVIIAALFLVLFFGLLYADKYYADRSDLASITPGLSRSNVVQRLGVMYDDSKPGEYADMDSVLAGMPGKDSIMHLCVWRVRYSRDLFWVGLDDADTVISVKLQKR